MNKEKYIEEVKNIKEVLSNMPQNTKKNKQKYLVYIKEKLDEYNVKKEELINEIEKRYNEIEAKKTDYNIDVTKLEERKKELLNKIVVFNTKNSPYEKIGLDKLVFNINRYYNDNLEKLNKDIKKSLDCFKQVGVRLTSEDFWYSKYLSEYMDVLIKEDDIEKARNKLDETYWKSPNIINQVAISLSQLYYKYEKNFKDYYDKKRDIILREQTKENLINEYNELIDKIESKKYTIRELSTNFREGTENIADYSEDKYEIYLNSISSEEINNTDLDKLRYSLYEYSIYQKYKFIIDDFLTTYKEKDKYKTSYKSLKNEIKKLEKSILKIKKKISLQERLFKNKTKIEMLELKLNNVIEELKEKYKFLEIEKVNEKISTLEDNIDYYDILRIISSHYLYLRNILVKNNEEITDKETYEIQNELTEFLLSNKLNILENISVLEIIDIPNTISNRYKLLNMKIESSEIENNLENLIEITRKLKIINSIRQSNVTYDELLYQVNSENIIKSEKEIA